MNKRVLFLCIIFLTQVSCQSLESFSNTFKKNVFGSNVLEKNKIIGIKISEARELLGEPMGINQIDKNTQAWYYKDVFVVFQNEVATSFEYYSSPIHDVRTVAFAGEIPKNKKISIISGIRNTDTNDLEFLSRTRPLKHMLELKNYKIVQINERPDYIALVKYGISEPMVEYKTWSTPVYTWVPGQSFSSTVSRNGQTSYINSSSSGSVAYAGERVHTQKQTSFRRYFVIEVIDYKAAKKGQLKQMWKAESESFGPSSDIDNILLSMYAATAYHWEKTTKGQKDASIAANDPMIQYLKTLL